MARVSVIRGQIDSPQKLGARLRQARDAAGLSQRELSFPGCTAAYISRVEKGERVPSLQIVERFAVELDVTVAWLLCGESGTPDSLLVEIERLRRETSKLTRRLAKIAELHAKAHAILNDD